MSDLVLQLQALRRRHARLRPREARRDRDDDGDLGVMSARNLI